MIEATQTAGTSPGSDPTLSTLIPQPSLRRNLMLASAAILVLVGAWVSPQVLRPSVEGNIGAGTSVALSRQHQVLATVQLNPEGGWPSVGAQSVGDLPGAKVAGAWVLAGAFTEPEATTRPADYRTGLDYVRAAFPNGRFVAASELPQRLTPGKPAQLFILWDITDCSRLIESQRPQIELTSILGTSTNEPLRDWSGPGFDLDTLNRNGICPTP